MTVPVTSPHRLTGLLALMRWDRPIGIYLLLWPTLWALWIAGEGQPPAATVVVFLLGVVLMRSAGCVINDYADRRFDGHVRRTQERPLITGQVSAQEARALFVLLLALAASLLFFLPLSVLPWAGVAAALATLYPFMKRVTHLPQVVLGAAFSMAIPMAYVALGKTPDVLCGLLFASNLAWTVAYDTQYALADRDEDVIAGVKSTAVLLGDLDRVAIATLQGLAWLGWLALGQQLQLGWPWLAGLVVVAGQFLYQARQIRAREPAACLAAFRGNHAVGAVLFMALLAGLLTRSVS